MAGMGRLIAGGPFQWYRVRDNAGNKKVLWELAVLWARTARYQIREEHEAIALFW